jgi:deoxyribonuclease-4
LYGSHLSIAGGLHNALIEARGLRMDCVQVFTKNQRHWQGEPLTEQQIADWRDHRARTGIDVVVSHDSYLINLASPDAGNLDKSIALFREELLRCEALEIPWLVTHPGAHMGEGEAAGLKRVARALDRIHKELPGLRTVTCLEITAGQGTSLGWRLEHLREIIEFSPR